MMINLHLSDWNTTRYFNNSITLYTKGWIEYEGQIYRAEKRFLFLDRLDINFSALKDIFAKFSGEFAIVAVCKEQVLIASDIVRSIPVFYRIDGDSISISSDIWKLVTNEEKINDNSIDEYISSGYVWGDKTFYKNIHGIQAGEILQFDGELKRERYFRYISTDQESKFPDGSIVKKLDAVFLNAVKKMVDSCPADTRFVIPLSGGHDSRLIVNYLYRLGVRNVLCYTYGVVGNRESTISKQVADALGYQWHFVEYTQEKIYDLRHSKLIIDFVRYTSQGTSLPHSQDFLALYEMQKNGILQKNDIIVPGHTFDFISGGHLLNMPFKSQKHLANILQKQHAFFWDKSSHFDEEFLDVFTPEKVDNFTFWELFDWQERQAKFIVNSIRSYEFFGCEWRIPLWDRELVKTWMELPYNWRLGRKFFLQVEVEFAEPPLKKLCQNVDKFYWFANALKVLDLFPSVFAIFVRSLVVNRKHPLLLHLFSSDEENSSLTNLLNNQSFPEFIRKRLGKYQKQNLTQRFCDAGLAVYVLDLFYSGHLTKKTEQC